MKTTIILMGLAMSMQVGARKNNETNNTKTIPDCWEYELKAGVNIGGASPLSLPAEIREIKDYSPKLNGTIEATVTRWLFNDKAWGVSTGLRIEEKGMKTDARVKNYSTEVLNDGNKVKGMWTGDVTTNYNSTLVTLPVMANYRFNDTWKVRAGMFVSYRMDGEFTGSVSNGYLREGNPTGERVEFGPNQQSTYDFSDDLRRFHYGLQIGGTWRAYQRFTVNADFTWGFNRIFKSEFKTVTFGMYPLNLNIGFGYRF